MAAIRVAIDTNVLIAALTRPSGSSARIVNMWRDGLIAAVSSDATIREAELVLGGAWLARLSSPQRVKTLLAELSNAIRVTGRSIHDLPLKDEGDLRLVEAAVAADATYLITTDRELLSRRGYAGTEFVTPVEFLRRMAQPDEQQPAIR